MKLSYGCSQTSRHPDQNPVILENERHWHIEMQLKRNEDETYTLIAMSGVRQRPAELSKLQGPYQTLQQGIAARSAIVEQLVTKGFSVLKDAHSIWAIQAQKAIQSVRRQRIDSQGNYDFHPDDVL